MPVTLNPEAEAMIRERVATGGYPDDAAVIVEALRLLEERDKLEYPRALIDEADASVARGELVDWTPDLLDQLLHEAAEDERNGVPIPDHVLP